MDQDPSIFTTDLQDANKKIIKKKVFLYINLSRFFLLHLLNDRRIWIRIQSRIRNWIHTSDLWIWIREAQRHVDPVDPDLDSDPDPEHWYQQFIV
jgi:hypothetical protein